MASSVATSSGAMGDRPRPILVSGMPRSGTTWLARLLATAPRTALAGREPMNPRGRQYALAGTLPGWVRLQEPDPRQVRALHRSYQGVNPWVYSRFGRRQWAAPFPWVKVVVKDPFAMLSLPMLTRVTLAQVVLIYRHPGAALASYRRMGWTVDVEGLEPLVDTFLRSTTAPGVTPAPRVEEVDDVGAIAWFWNCLHGIALADLPLTPGAVVLSHEDLAMGGTAAARAVFNRLGLRWNQAAVEEFWQSPRTQPRRTRSLHSFDRQPARAAREWRAKITPDERRRLESATGEVQKLLSDVRLELPPSAANHD